MPPSREFICQLGRITYNFQNIEAAYYLLANSLISSDQKIGHVLLSRLSFSHLCTVLINLFRHLVAHEEAVEELEYLIAQASDLEATRNQIIHSAYFSSGDESENVVTRAKISLKRSGFKSQLEEMEASDIQEIADDMGSLFEEILQFLGMVQRLDLVSILQGKDDSDPNEFRT